MASHEVCGVTIDATVQPIDEAPFWNDGETVDATGPDQGEERAENVPTPSEAVEGPDEPGQSTLDDWRWSR